MKSRRAVAMALIPRAVSVIKDRWIKQVTERGLDGRKLAAVAEEVARIDLFLLKGAELRVPLHSTFGRTSS